MHRDYCPAARKSRIRAAVALAERRFGNRLEGGLRGSRGSTGEKAMAGTQCRARTCVNKTRIETTRIARHTANPCSSRRLRATTTQARVNVMSAWVCPTRIEPGAAPWLLQTSCIPMDALLPGPGSGLLLPPLAPPWVGANSGRNLHANPLLLRGFQTVGRHYSHIFP